jgi:hypothetical protein
MAACSIRSTRRSSSLDAVQSAARLIGNDITGGSSGVRFWAPEAAGLPEDPKWRHRRRVPSISATTSAHLRAVVDGSGREVCIRCGPAASVQGVDSTLSFRRFNLLPQGNQHASGKRPSANVSFWAETRPRRPVAHLQRLLLSDSLRQDADRCKERICWMPAPAQTSRVGLLR